MLAFRAALFLLAAGGGIHAQRIENASHGTTGYIGTGG